MYRCLPILLLCLPLVAGASEDELILKQEELEAAQREQRELEDRSQALAAQLRETRRVQARQDELLNRLERELERLREQTP